MRKMPITTTLAALALLAGNAVQAEETKSMFQALDSDANGYISAEEAAANPDLHARWQEVDADKNNQLDMSEFSAFEGGMMEKEKAPSTPKY